MTFLDLIFEQKSTFSSPISLKLHHWGHSNEGPGFEKIQVCKMPYESAKIISDWEGITDNLRQSVILQYSDIGKYLLPLQHWKWILHMMKMKIWNLSTKKSTIWH